MALRRVLGDFLGGDVDVDRGVWPRRAEFSDVLELGLVVLAEQDVVQPQLGMESTHTPVKDDARRRAFLAQNSFRSVQVRQQLAVGGVQVGVADHQVGMVRLAMGVLHPGHASAVVHDALCRAFGEDGHAEVFGQLFQMQRDGAHATFRQKGPDAVFQMWNDVHHGRRLVRVAAVVRRVAVEQLLQLGLFELPGIVGVQRAQQGQFPNPPKEFPCGGARVRFQVVEASLQEHPAGQLEGITAGGKMTQQRLGWRPPARFHILGEFAVVRPRHQGLRLSFPEIVGAPVQGAVGECWRPLRPLGHQAVELLHQFWHGEEGRATVKPVTRVPMLGQLAAHAGTRFQHRHPVTACGHAHRCG